MLYLEIIHVANPDAANVAGQSMDIPSGSGLNTCALSALIGIHDIITCCLGVNQQSSPKDTPTWRQEVFCAVVANLGSNRVPKCSNFGATIAPGVLTSARLAIGEYRLYLQEIMRHDRNSLSISVHVRKYRFFCIPKPVAGVHWMLTPARNMHGRFQRESHDDARRRSNCRFL